MHMSMSSPEGRGDGVDLERLSLEAARDGNQEESKNKEADELLGSYLQRLISTILHKFSMPFSLLACHLNPFG